MNLDVILRMSGKQHEELRRHLLPNDGKEAVAFALCGRRPGESRHCLSVYKIILVPYSECERHRLGITWQTGQLVPLLTEAERSGAAIVKFHSHPGGYERFSSTDDRSDEQLAATISSWLERDELHASVVMLPDGRMFGRTIHAGRGFGDLGLISVAGEELHYWFADRCDFIPQFTERHAQVLSDETVGILRRLRAAVVGCSGTGSPTAEQLYRLGFGDVVLVDPEAVGFENLNRMLNSRTSDAAASRFKVDVLNRAIEDADLGTTVIPIAADLCDPDVVQRVAECDVIFGCTDSIFARHVLNKIASTYCIPYFDIGVRLIADGRGGIGHVTGAVHYLQPDGSSLMSRGVYTPEKLRADAMSRLDPKEYERRRKEGYIEGVEADRPAVICINMIFSGMGGFEFLCRLHPLRDESNARFAAQRISLSHSISDCHDDGERCMAVTRNVGRGDMTPLLGMPELSRAPQGQQA